MALGLTQPLVKMSTRNIPGGKGGRCVRLTSPPSRAECHEIWEPKPPGTLWAIPGLLWDSTFTFAVPLPTLQNFQSISQLIPLLKANVHTHMLQLTSLNTLQKMKTVFRLPPAMSSISV